MAGKNRAKNSVFIDKTGEILTGHVQLTNEINAVNDALTSHMAENAKKTPQIFNVRGYGAHSITETGYETFDSTQAILDCIDAMPAGSQMQFPTGHYRINSNILIDKSIDIDFGNSVIDCYTDTPFTFTGTLKSTHTVTVDYVESTSKNSLTLDSVEGIEVGDLINVISSELYDTSRAYYFKGGNAIVTGIAGNTVYFNLVFPFDMKADSIVVKIYTPIEVNIKNIKMLQGKNALSDTNYGLRIMYAKNSSIKNVKTDNFKQNISIHRSVNCELDIIDTGRAKNSTADDWDGYGIAIYSSTNISGKHIMTNSGQHGLTWGGQEVNFGLHFEDSVFKAEVWSLGVGSHANLYDVIFINCKIFGFNLSNNVTCINCDIMENELTTHQSRIACAESSRYANYKFSKCRFWNKRIVLTGDYQQVCPTQKYVGNIIFDDCSDFGLDLEVNRDSDGEKIAEIEEVKIIDCKECRFSASDIVDKLIIENSNSTKNVNILTQVSVNEVYQKIKTIVLKNISMPRRYNGIHIYNADTVIVKGLKYNDADYGIGHEAFENIGRLYLENYENSTAQRGLMLKSIGMLTIINSDLKFSDALNTVLANATIVEGRALKIGTEYMDIRTSTDGKRYKIQLDTNGAQVPTLIV